MASDGYAKLKYRGIRLASGLKPKASTTRDVSIEAAIARQAVREVQHGQSDPHHSNV